MLKSKMYIYYKTKQETAFRLMYVIPIHIILLYIHYIYIVILCKLTHRRVPLTDIVPPFLTLKYILIGSVILSARFYEQDC